ncbi:DEAD/DEAH box helicase [Glutamicibacter creatinolyticus]|uniref:DEAD/DEAH box helicase n=1 Tax=Glutamicibacter creatinolyticus TaxID=162496 RepID=UPI0032178973
MSYAQLLARRLQQTQPEGHHVTDDQLHDSLKPFQRQIIKWAVLRGRAAIWADTGLGKTRMQLEWARHSGVYSLVIAPLAVCQQTIEEAARIDIDATYIRGMEQVAAPGIYVTNYEMIDHIDATKFDAVVLDEASILKASDGKTRTKLIRKFADVPARLACTATPGPNDPEELTNQAEFLGVMTRTNMLAAYFIHDQNGWRIKGHAVEPMTRWMNTWAYAIRKPSDIGCDNTGYDLPPMQVIPEIVDVNITPDDGALIAGNLGGVTGRSRIRKETLAARCQRAAELVAAEPDEPWMLWCGLNDEADTLARLIPGAVNVHGSMTPEQKAEELHQFTRGETRVLITKPKIAQFGLNWQHCARTAFVGIGDSYEAYYQSIRRFHRYGQEREVHAHIILSEVEQAIADNVMRKEQQANRMIDLMIQQRKATR